MALSGARGAAVVDWTSGLALGTAGDSPIDDHEASCAEAAEFARLAAEQTAFTAAGSAPVGSPEAAAPVEDVIITTHTGYHLLCFVETAFDSTVFLQLWLDRDKGNLALARMRLRRLAEGLVLA